MVSPSVSLDSAANIALFCFHVILATLAVTINMLIVVAILASKTLRSENRFLYILNTCLGDFSLGALWFFAGLVDVSYIPKAIVASRMLMYNILGVIFLSILSSQCERHFAVVSPFRYMSIMTWGRSIGVLAFCWVFPFVMSLVYFLLGNATTSTIKGITNIVSNLAVFTIMCVLNIKLYLIAKVQQEREPVSSKKDTNKSSLKLIVVLSCTFLIFWSPSSVRECVCSFMSCIKFDMIAIDPFSILTAITAIINPVLYLWGSQAIRTAVWKTWTPCNTCKR
ncbi:adenosine receptor A2b-like [Discoglossus pictus]